MKKKILRPLLSAVMTVGLASMAAAASLPKLEKKIAAHRGAADVPDRGR